MAIFTPKTTKVNWNANNFKTLLRSRGKFVFHGDFHEKFGQLGKTLPLTEMHGIPASSSHYAPRRSRTLKGPVNP